MFVIEDYDFDHLNVASSPVAYAACEVFGGIVEFVFY